MKFDPTKPVQLRCGREARIICTDRKSALGFTIIALFPDPSIPNNDVVCTYPLNGHHINGNGEHPLDLVNIRTKKWLWVYKTPNGIHRVTQEHHTESHVKDTYTHVIGPVLESEIEE